jgi:tRNA(fMet)-specific endonuclease VapC
VRFLLDTNILSDLIRHPRGAVASRIAQLGTDAICTSIIVAAELRYGAAKKGSPKLAHQLEAVLSGLEVLPWDAPADEAYGHLRAALERSGRLIGPNDLLIAAQCLDQGATLITDNEREFRRVEGLTVENWLRSP